MSSSTKKIECRDEGCGLDGHSEHNWRLSLHTEKNLVFRKCAFCGLREQSKVKWSPEL